MTALELQDAPAAVTSDALSSATIGKLIEALVAVQPMLAQIPEDARNDHFKSKYATLDNVIETNRLVLASNGLTTIQRPMPSDRGVTLQTMIVHTSGEWIADGGLHLPAAKSDPQGFGSALTYARRYGLLTLLGLSTGNDDDGAAGTRATQAAAKPAAAPAEANPLTSNERKNVEKQALATGKFTPAAAKKRAQSMTRAEVAKFLDQCEVAIAERNAAV